ncbi:porin [Chlamydia pecorum]|uniref:Major outer membrane porin n=4 Tax=Chlamydia pecorum TaxID=85991 RepID=B8QS80_9CHLA|nr:porin [Chlamydia pecorum]ACG80790.1 major outer membrane protein [Chlamydia pecorum]ADB92445.1 major outer membrane protein [Chlamydia pecorum]ADB92446.1 major outer membrane protein [Chlamydia pecorum]ADB92447.1 major outer membrane protein [Chlamydia pecorum]ADB92448.1 major outer membrane protein [Chlamydia pecorum]
MKKLLKSAFLSAAFFAGDASLHALPVGNPAEPSLLIDGTIWEGMSGDPCDPCATWCDAISLRVGFYGDYVFDRVLKTDVSKMFLMGTAPTSPNSAADSNTTAERANPAYGKHMHDAEWFTNAGYIALNIWDRFDIFCTLGATSGYFKGNSASFNLIGLIGISGSTLDQKYPNASISNGVVELYTDTTFSWSVGARGALWECGCATLGAEFQYAQSKPRVQELNVLSNVAQFTVHKPQGYVGQSLPLPTNAGTSNASDLKNATINYHEWQVGAALSYRLNMLVPYIGIQWSRATFDADTIQVAQPKLASPIFNLTTWNPTLLGQATSVGSDKYADTLQIVSLQINKLKSRKACGVSMGATLLDADKWAINGELRLINERAAHLSAQCRF